MNPLSKLTYLICFFILTSCSSTQHKEVHSLSKLGNCSEATAIANEEFSGTSLYEHLGEIAEECEKNPDNVIKYYEKIRNPMNKASALIAAYSATNQCSKAESLVERAYDGNRELYGLALVANDCRKSRKKTVNYLKVAARNNYMPAIKMLIELGVTPPPPTEKIISNSVYNTTNIQSSSTARGTSSDGSLLNKCNQDGGTRMCYNRQSQRYGQTGGTLMNSGGGIGGMSGLSGMSGLK